MIPIQLTIEGLYSYQKRQTIDFSELTHAGLFGIFGATGSGKSSILEAISYALYGDTERLNTRDKRSYNMMNLKSNKAFIGFEFYNYEQELYRVTREFKRNSKRFEEVKTPKVVFYHYKNQNWEPLDHTNAEKIIGLSYKNFKRTIIIPQGQLKEYLELGAKERNKKIQNTFQLHQYDLHDKTARLKKENKSELDQITGQINSYEDITEGHLSTNKKELTNTLKTFSEKEKTHNAIDEKY